MHNRTHQDHLHLRYPPYCLQHCPERGGWIDWNGTELAGPDGVSPRVLKVWADLLCGTEHHLFDLSLSQERVTVLWKTSCLVLVNKNLIHLSSTTIDQFPEHPTASHIMKVLERLLLAHTSKQTSTCLDQLRFDMFASLFSSTVRIISFDFSSVFKKTESKQLWTQVVLLNFWRPYRQTQFWTVPLQMCQWSTRGWVQRTGGLLCGVIVDCR